MATTIEAHFELYALREGRWVLDACCADEDEARDEVPRLARSHGVRGVRLVREVKLPGMADPLATVLVDTTDTGGPVEVRRPAPSRAEPSSRAEAAATRSAPHPPVDSVAVPSRRGRTTRLVATVAGAAAIGALVTAGAILAL